MIEVLIAKYVGRTIAANDAQTEVGHAVEMLARREWRRGVEDALTAFGLDADTIVGDMLEAGDNYYLERGVDRPMCGGLWLDWKPFEG